MLSGFEADRFGSRIRSWIPTLLLLYIHNKLLHSIRVSHFAYSRYTSGKTLNYEENSNAFAANAEEDASSSARNVNYEKEAMTIYRSNVFENNVHVWILPLHLSQSKYGGRTKPSSACTLITVQIAYDFLRYELPMPVTDANLSHDLPAYILDTLINAVIDGNATHGHAMALRRNGHGGPIDKHDLVNAKTIRENAESMFWFLLVSIYLTIVVSFSSIMKKPIRDTFTVPEAIRVHRPEMHEIDYRCYSGRFMNNLISAFGMVVNSPYLENLQRIPIGVLAYERAMCFLYDRQLNTICVLDTHMHFRGKSGSIIAIAPFESIEDFVFTVTKCVFPEVFRHSHLHGQFEISCLMLTSIMNKIYKGKIFLTIHGGNEKPYFSRHDRLKIRQRKAVVEMRRNENENDSGYESDASEQ
ncbi:unnamed protein product [Caenorhabditis bovis]|uniref:Uncharacterized protein n=1 Tax=Caenorhabditis bovis TaxID=2654633 RepID=A0A8S1EB79_9PELO|nr:unnamed protein product [Caenorhabditis bovis]